MATIQHECSNCSNILSDQSEWWCKNCEWDVPMPGCGNNGYGQTHPQRRIMDLEEQVADLKQSIQDLMQIKADKMTVNVASNGPGFLVGTYPSAQSTDPVDHGPTVLESNEPVEDL